MTERKMPKHVPFGEVMQMSENDFDKYASELNEAARHYIDESHRARKMGMVIVKSKAAYILSWLKHIGTAGALAALVTSNYTILPWAVMWFLFFSNVRNTLAFEVLASDMSATTELIKSVTVGSMLNEAYAARHEAGLVSVCHYNSEQAKKTSQMMAELRELLEKVV